MDLTYDSIARTIDHAVLAPHQSLEDAKLGCALALRYGIASICVKPYAIPTARELLAGSDVGVGTVIGFPHGGQSTAIKVAETGAAIDAGASEIDMVINIAEAAANRWEYVEYEIEEVTREVRRQHALIKIIFENCYLSDEQKRRLCEICGRARVDYVKTSTGFGTSGANADDLILMRRFSPEWVKVKASGGIKDLNAAKEFIAIGCGRLGTSRTSEILDQWADELGLPHRSVSRETKPSELQY